MSKKDLKFGFQVMEFSSTGGKHSISKVYPTWLGCKRVRNRIARENRDLVGYRYTVELVDFSDETDSCYQG